MKNIHTHPLRTAGKSLLCTTLMATGTALIMVACSSNKLPLPREYSQETLPQSVMVPSGHKVALETRAAGVLDYECRATPAGPYGWVLMSPRANLLDLSGKDVIAYSGPPATWTHVDGSRIVGNQVSVAANGEYNLPLQLSRAEPATGTGALQDVSFIQRIKTKGGVEKTKPCTTMNAGEKVTLPYQADYIFWRPA